MCHVSGSSEAGFDPLISQRRRSHLCFGGAVGNLDRNVTQSLPSKLKKEIEHRHVAITRGKDLSSFQNNVESQRETNHSSFGELDVETH